MSEEEQDERSGEDSDEETVADLAEKVPDPTETVSEETAAEPVGDDDENEDTSEEADQGATSDDDEA
jgi:hypothetical protein